MILTYDVETSSIDILHRQYDLKVNTKYFNYHEIERDWHMLGAAWKWLHEPTAQCVSVRPSDPLNDEGVIRTLHPILAKADILIGHNSDRFDYRKFNARAIKHGLPPLAPKKTIDTLKVARRGFAFTSNSLGYICQHLGLGGKDESPDWNKCLAGDEEELRKMRGYNKTDVYQTEKLYMLLRPFITNHPDLNILNPIRDVVGAAVEACPACQSTELSKNGTRAYKSSTRQQFMCKSCNHPFVGKTLAKRRKT